MSESIEIRRIKDFIKSVIRKKGHNYEDLANALNVSVTTVKRVLNKDDLSLKRLNEILKWLGLSFSDVATLSEESGRKIFSKPSEEQEKFLAENTAHLCVLEGLMAGMTSKQIRKKYRLNEASLNHYLHGLDKQNLIELHPNGRVRMLIKGLEIRRGGPISTAQADILGHIAKEDVELGLLFGNNPPKFSFHFNTNMWMREKTLEQFHKELKELDDKYTSISITEEAVEPVENLVPVHCFFILHKKEINERLYEKPKNLHGTEETSSLPTSPPPSWG